MELRRISDCEPYWDNTVVREKTKTVLLCKACENLPPVILQETYAHSSGWFSYILKSLPTVAYEIVQTAKA